MEKQSYRKPKTQTVRRSVPARKRLSESEGDGVCVVCAHPIEIYAVGDCNHYICFKCCTKIRLLCEESLCPVCRKELSKVIFSKNKETFEVLNRLKLIKDRQYDVGIFFADIAIIKEYNRILEHRCPVCPNRPPDKTFEGTVAHLRKEHTLFYCEICLKHNRTFTSECKTYSRKDLATHKRVGDADDKSHRGHPLCKYCDERYLDEDKLFHHLRTTHFYCHLCDQEETNEFYGTYLDLREHFKSDHYLCEEGDCINEEFTSVFGSQLDYKAHCATAHREGRSKQQLKKDRQIDLVFQYARREPQSSRGSGFGRGRGSDRSRSNGQPRSRHNQRFEQPDYSHAFERDSDLARGIALSLEESNKPVHKKVEKEREEKQLGASSSSQNAAFYRNDFPVLTAAVAEKSEPQTSQSTSAEETLLWSKDAKHVTSRFKPEEDFPSLPSQTRPASSGSSSWNSKSAKIVKKTKDQGETKKITNIHNVPNHPKNKKNLKNSKTYQQSEEDFPKLNEVPVERGSSKHRDMFENSSSRIQRETTKIANTTNSVSKPNQPKSKKTSKSSKADQRTEEDFSKLNEVLIGRVSSKHSEVFENYSDGNQQEIKKDAKAPKLRNSKTYQQSEEDFPKLNEVPVERGSSKHRDVFENSSSRIQRETTKIANTTNSVSKPNQPKSKKTSKSSKADQRTEEDFSKLNEVLIGRVSSKHSKVSENYSDGNQQEIKKDAKATNKVVESYSPKNKKDSKNFEADRSTEENFPKLNSLNEVLVGRGSFKHREFFESYSSEIQSNVNVVHAGFKSLTEANSKSEVDNPKAKFEFKTDKDEFPSLETVSAPPGFTNISPFLTRNSFSENDKKINSRPSTSTTVRPPPGFNIPLNQPVQKEPPQQNIKNNFTSSVDDFPSLPFNEIKPTLSIINGTANISSEPVPAQTKIKPSAIVKGETKKKSKGFRSKNRDADFPALANNAPLVAEPRKTTTAPPKSSNPIKSEKTSSKTNLNLANVFDFPSL